jgi:hypothetical protein
MLCTCSRWMARQRCTSLPGGVTIRLRMLCWMLDPVLKLEMCVATMLKLASPLLPVDVAVSFVTVSHATGNQLSSVLFFPNDRRPDALHFRRRLEICVSLLHGFWVMCLRGKRGMPVPSLLWSPSPVHDNSSRRTFLCSHPLVRLSLLGAFFVAFFVVFLVAFFVAWGLASLFSFLDSR